MNPVNPEQKSVVPLPVKNVNTGALPEPEIGVLQVVGGIAPLGADRVEVLQLEPLTFEQVMQLDPEVIRNLPEAQLANIPSYIKSHLQDFSDTIAASHNGVDSELRDKWDALWGNPFIESQPLMSGIMGDLSKDIGWQNTQVELEKQNQAIERIQALDAQNQEALDRYGAGIEELKEIGRQCRADMDARAIKDAENRVMWAAKEAEHQRTREEQEKSHRDNMEEQEKSHRDNMEALDKRTEERQRAYEEELASLNRIKEERQRAHEEELARIRAGAGILLVPQVAPRPPAAHRSNRKYWILALAVVAMASIYFGRNYANRNQTKVPKPDKL
ncbi:hypothetical protein [Candidatus Neptunichlamydia sp. REUL1]|uniref:hypothetical protein n=1 Tax=Candidatus Neptunichlamydia sp. REUL1 TaxID=3064277 RepID=UPI00292F027D|nr:hypothetical protein [Candidatus Neptunochlamydia sp. REUL1]